MDNIHELLSMLRPWLSFKVLEFVEAGYESITTYDLARYLATYRWRHSVPDNPYERIYQVNHLQLNEYFDFEAIEAQTSKTETLETLDLSALF